MEGDSVTLHTGLTEIQRDDTILWTIGPPDTRIADIYMKIITIYDERFRGIQLDITTGSLTIKNIRGSYSGLYKLTIFSQRGVSHKAFPVTVYGELNISYTSWFVAFTASSFFLLFVFLVLKHPSQHLSSVQTLGSLSNKLQVSLKSKVYFDFLRLDLCTDYSTAFF